MTILKHSSGCASCLPCFLDSSWLGLTESRSFPTRIAITCDGSSRTHNGQKSFPILSSPRWAGDLKCGSTPFCWLLLELWGQGGRRDHFKSHVFPFWMATTVKKSDIDMLRRSEKPKYLLLSADWRVFSVMLPGCYQCVTSANQKVLSKRRTSESRRNAIFLVACWQSRSSLRPQRVLERRGYLLCSSVIMQSSHF